jgi:hypothetical protein
LAELDPAGAPDLRQELLRSGYDHGADEVARLAGIRGNPSKLNVRGLIDTFEQQFFTKAIMQLRHGQLDPAMVLRQAATMLARRKDESTPESQDIGGITSLGPFMLRALDELVNAGKEEPRARTVQSLEEQPSI